MSAVPKSIPVVMLLAGFALCAFAMIVSVSQSRSKPPRAVNAVAVVVCGVTPVILVSYSDGSLKDFHPPFAGVPVLPAQWELPISVSSCTGTVTLEPAALESTSVF